MDAHLFSRFCEELAPRIIGGWLEKVQEPAPGLLAFNINLAARGQSYGQAGGSRKCQLCLRAARKEPFLFLSRSRLAAGRAPSAPVMRLRKYLAGHRILATVCCFSRRRLWLLVGGEAAAEEALRRWLHVCALVRPGSHQGTVMAVGEPDARAIQALIRLDAPGFAARELAERVATRFPPAARLVQFDGPRAALDEAEAAWRPVPGAEHFGPVPLETTGEGETWRSVIVVYLEAA